MDNLLNLVRSLSAKEKSQYVKYARQHLSGKDSYKVVLFQFINQEIRGQISDYKKQAQKKIPASTLPSVKTQLYNHILTSLTQNSIKTIRGELSQMIDEIHILFDRGLLKQALNRIEKAKKIADEYQFHFVYLEISLLQRGIFRKYKTRDVEELISGEQNACVEKINLVSEEFELLNHYESYFLKRRMERLSKEKIKAYKLKWKPSELNSFEGKMYFYLLEQLNSNVQKNYKKGLVASKKLIELFEKNELILLENIPRYLRLATNYMNACFRVGDFDAAKNKLEELKELKTKNFYSEAQKQGTITSQEIILYFQLEEYKKIINMAPTVKEVLHKYDIFIPFERSLGIAYNMAISFFMHEDLNGSLEWLNICLEAKDHSELKEKVTGKDFGIFTQGSAMVFRVIVFYSLGKIKLAKHFISPATYYLEKRGLDETLLSKILFTLRKIIVRPKEKETLLSELLPDLKKNQQYEEYLLWLERELLGMSL